MSTERNRGYMLKDHRTKKGQICRIMNHQRSNSKQNGWPPPSYDLSELQTWMLDQSVFHNLFEKWVQSDYEKKLLPSCDRLDDYKPYTLDNLRIVTWNTNHHRSTTDRLAGINTKAAKAILQYTTEGIFIFEHYSMRQAARNTGIDAGSICKACSGKLNSAGGFKWKHKLDLLLT